MPLETRLALVAIAVAIVGVPMSDTASPFLVYGTYALAIGFLIAAVSGNHVWGRWTSWRLRGIRFQPMQFNDRTKVWITLTVPVKHGLLITCSPPQSRAIERETGRETALMRTADSPIRPTLTKVLAQGRGNRVLVYLTASRETVQMETTVDIDLAPDIEVTSVEPATRRIVRQFLGGVQ